MNVQSIITKYSLWNNVYAIQAKKYFAGLKQEHSPLVDRSYSHAETSVFILFFNTDLIFAIHTSPDSTNIAVGIAANSNFTPSIIVSDARARELHNYYMGIN